MDRNKVSKTGDCRKLLGQPYGRNASSMKKNSEHVHIDMLQPCRAKDVFEDGFLL